MKETIYYVWRRSDGYVAATAYLPRDYPSTSFELLLETACWAAAHARIVAERVADEMCADMEDS